MKKFALTLCFCLIATMTYGQNAVNPLTKSTKEETARYVVMTESEFGKDKNFLIFKMTEVGYSRLDVRKTMKWKGREHVRDTEYRINATLKDLVKSMKKNLMEKTKGWNNPKIEMKGGVGSTSVSLNKSVQIEDQKRSKNSPNQIQSKKKNTKSSFSCYKLSFVISGQYQKKDAKMTATYWVAKPNGTNRVPVFGLVKSEVTVEQTIKKVKFTGKITMTLQRFTRIEYL